MMRFVVHSACFHAFLAAQTPPWRKSQPSATQALPSNSCLWPNQTLATQTRRWPKLRRKSLT